MTPAAESSGYSCVVSESEKSAADEAAAPGLRDSIESAAELFGDD